MITLKLGDLRTFIPAKDFENSKQFYVALGWAVKWSDNNLALMELDGKRFYLQNYYLKEWAENSMLHLSVADAQDCYTQIQAMLDSEKFPDAKVSAPKHESYGALVTYVWDPAGVLLHLAQWD